MSNTKIEWTNAVWNPVTGCSKVSDGCKNCYAEPIAKRFWGSRPFTDVVCHDVRLDIPLRWKKPRMIFVNSMSDLFHEKVPFEFIEKVYDTMFDTMFNCKQHIFQILTKRPQVALKFYEFMNTKGRRADYDNIWFGVSIENQKTADERLSLLKEIPAVVRWVSCEPLLSDVNLSKYLKELHWVVVGGESGAKRRRCKIEWIESIAEQCKSAGVPIFVKQLSINGKVEKDINKFPEHLRIREFPK